MPEQSRAIGGVALYSNRHARDSSQKRLREHWLSRISSSKIKKAMDVYPWLLVACTLPRRYFAKLFDLPRSCGVKLFRK